MTHKTIHPENWLPAKGYANGILTKDGVLHIGGQIGWDGNKKFASDNFIDQMRQALSNIRQIVETAGGKVEDVTRLTWFVTSKAEYITAQKEVGAAYREVFGQEPPLRQQFVDGAPRQVKSDRRSWLIDTLKRFRAQLAGG